MIIIGAALWGTIGVFVQGLYDLGFTPLEVVALRVIFAFLAIFLFVLQDFEFYLIDFVDSFLTSFLVRDL